MWIQIPPSRWLSGLIALTHIIPCLPLFNLIIFPGSVGSLAVCLPQAVCLSSPACGNSPFVPPVLPTQAHSFTPTPANELLDHFPLKSQANLWVSNFSTIIWQSFRYPPRSSFRGVSLQMETRVIIGCVRSHPIMRRRGTFSALGLPNPL